MDQLPRQRPARPLAAPLRALGVVELIALLLAGLALACDVAAVRRSGSLGTDPFFVFAGVLALLAVPVAGLATAIGKSRAGCSLVVVVTSAALVGAIVIPIAAR